MKDYKIDLGSLLILPPVDKTGRDIRVSIGLFDVFEIISTFSDFTYGIFCTILIRVFTCSNNAV